MKNILTAAICLMVLGGCSLFESKTASLPVVHKPGEDPPFTKDVVNSIPKGLLGDSKNQRHTSEALRGDTGGQ